MSIFKALGETPVGQALIAFWHDLPFWFLLGALLALALLPALYFWQQGAVALAVLLTCPAAFVLSGIARAFAQTVAERPPRWDAFRGQHLRAGLSVWCALALVALTFAHPAPAPIFWLQCGVAAFLLLLAPLVLCGSALLGTPPLASWRNGLVMAVHRPQVAVGLVALAVLLAWAAFGENVLLSLLVPGLWISIAVYSTSSLLQQFHDVSNGA